MIYVNGAERPLLSDIVVDADKDWLSRAISNLVATAPTIADLTNAQHAHAAAASGGGPLTPTTIAATDATDASSPTTAAVKTAGGLGVAKKGYFGDSIILAAANAKLCAKDPTNAGVAYLGGGVDVGDSVSMLDNQTMTITIGNTLPLIIANDDAGNGGAWIVRYNSATIIELADLGGIWSITDVDLNPGWAIYKAVNSRVVTIKNYMNATRSLYINILGSIQGATAPV